MSKLKQGVRDEVSVSSEAGKFFWYKWASSENSDRTSNLLSQFACVMIRISLLRMWSVNQMITLRPGNLNRAIYRKKCREKLFKHICTIQLLSEEYQLLTNSWSNQAWNINWVGRSTADHKRWRFVYLTNIIRETVSLHETFKQAFDRSL